jgi:hypothetical protein
MLQLRSRLGIRRRRAVRRIYFVLEGFDRQCNRRQVVAACVLAWIPG